MPPQRVIATYRPRGGQEAALRAELGRHVPTLRRLGLATGRAALVMRSFESGTYIEVFEWASAEAARQAHTTPEVAQIWKAMEAAAEFVSLASLEEATRAFPHFEPIDDLTG